MNNLFDEYIESLTPAKKIIAREAVATYLKGESAKVEQIRSAAEINAKMRYFANYEDEHAAAILMNQAGKIIKVKELSLQIRLIDHVIISNEGYYSYADNDRI